MSNPLVSVVMPVYNGEKYLNEAIESILNQTFTDFEFIILNDGSTDRIEKIILSYDDSRIHYVKNEKNLQIVKTLNKGISLAKGKYIARMDADDISQPERFEKQVRFMEDNPEIDVCGTWLKTFGDNECIWEYPLSHHEIKSLLLFNSALAHPSIITKRALFDRFKYSEEYEKAEDYFLWVQLINDKTLANIPHVLLNYRLHIKQTDKSTQSNITNKVRKVMLARVGCDLTDAELDLFFNISNFKYVPISSIGSIFSKILMANQKSQYISHKILERTLSNRFWMIVNKSTYKGMTIFFQSLYSPIRNYNPLSFQAYAKLFIKCLFRYSHEK